MSQEEEEEEEEHFFESLDRILSSPPSSSSLSSSSTDVDEGDPGNLRGNATSSAASMYHVWVAEPAPVEERRRRLLIQLGLGGGGGESGGLEMKTRLGSGAEHLQSNCISLHADRHYCHESSSSSSVSFSPAPPQIHSNSIQSSWQLNSICCCDPPTSVSVHNHTNNDNCSRPRPEGDSSLASVWWRNGDGSGAAVLANKPPVGGVRGTRRMVEEVSVNVDYAEDAEDLEVNPQRMCTIRNLDNGSEFVVNEFGEDGMWNKLREVGTGRQLTREEFEMCVGHSPIVQELMRRQNFEDSRKDREENSGGSGSGGSRGGGGSRVSKKRGGWLRSIKHVASSVARHRERRSSDERDTSSEKGGRRSSSATDDSQDVVLFHTPLLQRTKVRHYGKSCKELTALYMSQKIQAHTGSIWSIKFSSDGRYLASAGEDRVIHVWQVLESKRTGDLFPEKVEDGNSTPFFAATNGSPEPTTTIDHTHHEKKRKGKVTYSRKSMNLDHVVVPEDVFMLSDKPFCSFQGHLADVLDLSWSKSQFQYLLSSSMDKTVRLWDMSSYSCLKVFSHSDYVTCIQFNPVNDDYFISGSLDAKVRIWSIQARQVVDWNDLHEMVTAACYTPDGQGALVGTHKGSCHLYNTSDNKLLQKGQIDLQNKKKKSHVKKITGFQFAPGSSSEVLVTSADSRIKVANGVDLVHKFKGFRNTNSQISASLTANSKYVVCASEDSQVYVWRYENDFRPSRSKGVTITQSYEHFHCPNVTVAIPWPCINLGGMPETFCVGQNQANGQVVDEGVKQDEASLPFECTGSPLHVHLSESNGNCFSDRVSATWPEEKLLAATEKHSSSQSNNDDLYNGRTAWGMVIVTAGLGGEIKTFQNFGLPVPI